MPSRSNDNRLTPYRNAVLEALRGSHNHPTAAEIFRKVRRRRPGVAYATIYNALDWLTRQGLIVELQAGDGASRYDPITTRHDHFICTRCGRMLDYEAAVSSRCWAEAAQRQGFVVQRYRLELHGLCPQCAAGGSAIAS